jgi:hypothetical protein
MIDAIAALPVLRSRTNPERRTPNANLRFEKRWPADKKPASRVNYADSCATSGLLIDKHYGIRNLGNYWVEGITPLSWLHELRFVEMARMGLG